MAHEVRAVGVQWQGSAYDYLDTPEPRSVGSPRVWSSSQSGCRSAGLTRALEHPPGTPAHDAELVLHDVSFHLNQGEPVALLASGDTQAAECLLSSSRADTPPSPAGCSPPERSLRSAHASRVSTRALRGGGSGDPRDVRRAPVAAIDARLEEVLHGARLWEHADTELQVVGAEAAARLCLALALECTRPAVLLVGDVPASPTPSSSRGLGTDQPRSAPRDRDRAARRRCHAAAVRAEPGLLARAGCAPRPRACPLAHGGGPPPATRLRIRPKRVDRRSGPMTRPGPRIALCMIVRDEAGIVERCLRSVTGLVDSWVICDTGSTDETPEIVRATLDGVPGQLHHTSWVDFGHNRSELMRLAEGAGDYLLLLDADMTIDQRAPLPELTATRTCSESGGRSTSACSASFAGTATGGTRDRRTSTCAPTARSPKPSSPRCRSTTTPTVRPGRASSSATWAS